ncbi:MAG: DNA translocase FtsK [Candidatus Marinimicrobia bacterium]|nr:DNA translocase FtsK [Candidatus Neomarinimicrobiota bacterium]
MVVSVLFTLSLASYSERDELLMNHHGLIDNSMGIAGVFISYFLIKLGVGYFAWGFIPILLAWGVFVLFKIDKKILKRSTWFSFGLIFLLSILFSIDKVAETGLQYSSGFIPGGLVGGSIAYLLSDWIGVAPSIIIIITSILILISGFFRFSLTAPIRSLKNGKRVKKADLPEEMRPVKTKKEPRIKKKKIKEHKKIIDAPGDILDAIRKPLPETEQTEDPKSAPIKAIVKPRITTTPVTKNERPSKKQVFDNKPYILPSTDLLIEAPISSSYNEEELQRKATLLTETLPKYGVDGKVVRILPGPVITLYEVAPGEGVRVNKFTNLSNDIARVMAAKHVRIIAPIPGRTVVGVEIPNNDPEMIYFHSIVNSKKYRESKSLLSIAVGKTAEGIPYIFELDKMPHLLVAGTTGSGKSVCINTIIMSILYRATPEEVKFILIDPKKIELSIYKALEPYHLITSVDIDEYVITNAQNAILALRSALVEMDSRYDKLASITVRSIYEYNAKMKALNEPIMPFIVVVIDELADLMSNPATRTDIELPIQRLAQMSRAVGIHLVIATQRPSVDVITGLIRSNIPARIAFNVATRIDSRTILDTGGAEMLLGKGDMLFLPPGRPQPIRIHNAYLTLEEIEKVLSHIKRQPKNEDEFILPTAIEPEPIDEINGTGNVNGGNDALFDEAMKLVILHQQGSASLLQRRLKVGYSRAGRLIDELEEAGIVGPSNGSKAREVFAGPEYLDHLRSIENDPVDEDDE